MEQDHGLLLFHRLRRASMELELARGEFARLNGLHTTDLRALIALLDAGRTGRRATPGWLGEQLGLNSAGITSLLDRLERLGRLQRVRDTEGRRRVFLEVTAKAVELGWSFFGPLIDAAIDEMGGPHHVHDDARTLPASLSRAPAGSCPREARAITARATATGTRTQAKGQPSAGAALRPNGQPSVRRPRGTPNGGWGGGVGRKGCHSRRLS